MTPKREAKREYAFHWVIPFVIGAVAGGVAADSYDKDWLIGASLGATATSLVWWHFPRPSRVMDINIKIDSSNK